MAIKMPSQEESRRASAQLEAEGQVDRYTQMIKAGQDENYAIWYNLGVAYTNLEEWDNALEAYEKAVDLEPQMAQAWVNMAAVKYRTGHLAEAEELNRKALEITPDFMHARSNLGMVLLLLGKYDESIEEMNKVLEQEPKHPVALAALTQAYNAKGDTEKGAEFKKKAEEAGIKFEDK
ncbi:tetratricopeptide repeat protein [bacterium]|nr:tetratricopeptide repeat protein [bacterium]